MLFLIDKRTNFYYLSDDKRTIIAEDEQGIPSFLRNDPNIIIEYFDVNEESSVLTSMLNNGISEIIYEGIPFMITIEDLLYLNPNHANYYYSLQRSGKQSAESALWEEDLYLLVDISKDTLNFIKIELGKKKYILAFISKVKAVDFLSNNPKYDKFYPVRFRPDKNFRYCVLEEEPFFLEHKNTSE